MGPSCQVDCKLYRYLAIGAQRETTIEAGGEACQEEDKREQLGRTY